MEQDKMYHKGIETRSKIVEAAKKVFYNHGYKNGTVTMITEEAGVSLSAIPYYFGKKEEIVKTIYNEFLESIYASLQENLPEQPDSFLMHFYASKIYYYIILGDENNWRFYREVNLAEQNYMMAYPFIDAVYDNYAKDFNIPISQTKRQMIRITDGGARREILDCYYKKVIDVPVDYLIDYITSIAGILTGIHPLVADKYGKKSTEFVKTLDYSHIKLLV
ncbi:MAG: TetR/AcrR family transcriptional regulator [Actinobacteria bacterium]|nr:TetR/AcrR family transcriptional regulator [Actinomycetota bacterium]